MDNHFGMEGVWGIFQIPKYLEHPHYVAHQVEHWRRIQHSFCGAWVWQLRHSPTIATPLQLRIFKFTHGLKIGSTNSWMPCSLLGLPWLQSSFYNANNVGLHWLHALQHSKNVLNVLNVLDGLCDDEGILNAFEHNC